jgi:hypothetical protein
MEHDRLFHDALFIVLGLAWIVFVLRLGRFATGMTRNNETPASFWRGTRIGGITLGAANIFIVLMDILHATRAH